jgi:hypothetical protein
VKNTQVCDHIRDLCAEKKIDYKQLHSLLCDAIDYSLQEIDYPDPSIVNRWLNGQTGSPDKKWFPFIAKALDVPEEEIAAGKETDATKAIKEANRWAEMYNLNQQEKEKITRIIWWGKYHLIIFGLYSLDLGVLYLNFTLWKNGLVFLINIAIAVGLYRYDNRKYKKEAGIGSRQKLKDRARDEIGFYKSLFQDNIVSHITLIIIVTICVLGFLPFIESLFYKGTFYLSSTIYFVIAFLLIVQSVIKK